MGVAEFLSGLSALQLLRSVFRGVCALLSAVVLSSCAAAAVDRQNAATNAAKSEVCSEAGRWLDPQTQELLQTPEVMARLASSNIVLLGETHTSKEHHLWQTHTLAGLHAHRSRLVIGFESFPRSSQAALDAWSEGGVSQEQFLRASRWSEVWGYGEDLYMPMFDFARQNRLPMRALNVERSLVSRVGQKGWEAIPASDREGLGDPAPASRAYQASLARVFFGMKAHGARKSGEQPLDQAAFEDEERLEEMFKEPSFQRFVQAQLTWDRAMAEALAQAHREDPGALVVGILGRGHVEYGYGVPHQLADLGVDKVVSLIPVEIGTACDKLEATLADAVFLVDASENREPAPARPRLGVAIESTQGGLKLLSVAEGSVAEAASLAEGDVLVSAAGVPVERPSDLIEIVQRQAPGTWLPLDVRRGDRTLQLVAKFPADTPALTQ